MPLSEDERQRLREEEVYRTEVRRSLEAVKPPAGASQRLSTFLESKVGFWMLITAFAAISATLFTGLSNWLHRAEIEERQRAERARQDFDTVIKVMPMLTSENAGNRLIGFSLLNGLASAKSIQPEIAAQITSTLQLIVVAGAAPNASPEARTRADELVRLVDAAGPRVALSESAANAANADSANAQPAPPPSTLSPPPATKVAPAIVAITLPLRVYVQIGSEARRAEADKAVQALRAAGVLAPGVERVRTVPRTNQLRYCGERMLEASRDAVVQALASVSIPVEPTLLAPKFCGNVRPNHFELWLGSNT